jgi:hypothetical protein
MLSCAEVRCLVPGDAVEGIAGVVRYAMMNNASRTIDVGMSINISVALMRPRAYSTAKAIGVAVRKVRARDAQR